MTIRSILVPLFGNGADTTALAAAADVAQRMQAHVTALYCEPDIADLLQPVPGWEEGGLLTEALVRSLQDHAKALRNAADRQFSNWLNQSGAQFASSPDGANAVTAELIMAEGRPASVIRDYAVVADLVVASLSERSEPNRFGVLEATLFESGRPVLGLPASVPDTIFKAPVAIAWNYSAEAARALSTALPIVRAVGEAVVLLAGHHEDDAAAGRIVSFLGWHGVKAGATKLGQAHRPGELIAAKVRELGAGLLVMGAYSHTRAREFVFGGVTSHMLENAPVPVLFAH